MPLLEAFPETTQNLRYKLITLPRGTAKMPVLDVGLTQITLKQGASLVVTPQTLNYLGSNQVFESSGYTAIIADVRTMNVFEGVGINTTQATNLNASQTLVTFIGTVILAPLSLPITVNVVFN